MIGRRCKRGILYYLNQRNFSVVHHVDTSPYQWHCRLGHPPLDKLKVLVPSLSSISKVLYDDYQLRKHYHISFLANTDEHCSRSFSLIHNDILDPVKIRNKHNFACYVIFWMIILV